MHLVNDIELCLADYTGLNLTQRINRVEPGVQQLILAYLLGALSQDTRLSALNTPNFV